MDKIDKVINDIERRRREYIEISEKYPEQSVCEVDAVLGELDEILAFINSLPDEPASEDLEKAADEYEEERLSDYGYRGEWSGAFIAGAKWQVDQFEKNRLAHCDGLSEEDNDRETDFAMEIIEKEHRHPTFIDAINYGMRLQKEQMEDEWLKDRDGCFWDGVNEGKKVMKEQMMKEAVEGYVNYYEDSGGILMAEAQVGCPYHNGDKVRIIVCKKED